MSACCGSIGLTGRTRARLVEQVTVGRHLPAEMMKQIIDRTDGIPLFVEELTKMVLESGLLVEDAGRYRLDRPLPPLAIPATLQDSLMARLDRLAPVKEVAQIGAAIGRDFSYTLLQSVAGRDDLTLSAALAATRRGRTAGAPRGAAGSDLQLQARARSGSGVREPAQEPAATAASAHRRRSARQVSGRRRDRAGSPGIPFH
jgi:hypothetical protein